MLRIPRVVLIGSVGLAAVSAALVAPPSFAAGSDTGTLAGSLGAAKPPASWAKPVVVAQRLDVIGQSKVIPISASGRFRAKVPAGMWAVTVPTMKSGQVVYSMKVLSVHRGRTATFRGKPMASTLAPIRIQVAPTQATTPLDAELAAAVKNRRDINVADLLTNLDTSSCNAGKPNPTVAVVEYRGPGGRYAEVLREVKLQQSRFFDAQTRAWARQAEREHKRWKPNFTLGETLGVTNVNGVDVMTSTYQLKNDLTGAVMWEKTYSGSPPGDYFWESTELAAKDLVATLCQPESADTSPAGMHIKATATLAGADTDAKATLKLSAEYDVWSRPGEPGNYDLAAPIIWSIDSTTFAGLGSCPKVSTGASQFAASTPSGGATLHSGKAGVFVSSLFQVGWQETPPPDSCTSPGVLALGLIVNDLTVPLGGTATSTGSGMPGQTYTITATVTPLTKRP